MTVKELGGFLGAGYLFLQDKQSPSGVRRNENDIQERAGLGIAGDIYSPGFLRYEGTGVVGFTQAWADDGEDSTFDNGELYEFDTSAHLFPSRIHPANLYFSRIQDLRPRLFLSQLETTTTLARAEQSLILPDGDIRLSAERREIDQEQSGFEETKPFLKVAETSASISSDYRLTKEQSVFGGYTFRDVDQDVEDQSYRAHSFDAYHNLNLGALTEFQLRSRIEGELQDGALDRRFFRWTENLNYQILQELRSDGIFYYTQNDTNLTDLKEIRGDVGLTHQLYESLTTSVRFLGGRSTSGGQNTTDNLGTRLGLSYQKNDPIGIIRINYSNYLERRFTDNENNQGGVIDEAHRFPIAPPEDVRLVERLAILSTLTVTDPTGFIFYREGIDYTVTQDPSGITTISRVFTGNIMPGGDILVDYLFEIGADYVLDTITQTARVEHEFTGGLTPYFLLYQQDQKVSDVVGSAQIEPVRELGLLGGLEWRRPTWLAGGEYENRESTILPFDAIRLRALWSDNITSHNRLSLQALQTWLFYRDPDRQAAVTQGIGHFRMDLSRDAYFYLDSAVQYTDDSLQGSGLGFSVGGGVEFKWRLFSLRLRVAHRESHGETTDFRGEELGFWIVREFGSPPPSTTEAMNRFLRQ